MTDPSTLKAFVLEYAKVHNLDPVDIGMIAGSFVPDYLHGRAETLSFILEMKQEAPTLFQTIKFIKNNGEGNTK